MPEMPDELETYHHQIAELVDSLHLGIPDPVDGRKPKRNPINEENFAKKEFQELWNRINHKAVYQVDFKSPELITKCVAALDRQLEVAPLQYVVIGGEQAAEVDADKLSRGEGFSKIETTTHNETAGIASQVKYDLLGEIAEKTTLTRRTVCKILEGVQTATFKKFRDNPEQFITETARIVNEQKATTIVEHLTYDTLDDRYDSAIFTENQTKQDFTNAGDKLKKHIYDYVVADSKVEREFVAELDKSTEVVVYAKLPRGFFIPTPVGNYNPDWAIAFQEGSVKHVYFVAETKGSMSTMELRPSEKARIECATKFFDSLNEKSDGQVKYEVFSKYEELMAFVK